MFSADFQNEEWFNDVSTMISSASSTASPLKVIAKDKAESKKREEREVAEFETLKKKFMPGSSLLKENTKQPRPVTAKPNIAKFKTHAKPQTKPSEGKVQNEKNNSKKSKE